MRIAILTDIHANREAFEAVLAASAALGAGRHVILGDIVGYGADPIWCVETVMAMAEAGAAVVRGNHDQAVYDPRISLNETARATISWTAGQLSAAHRNFLAALPLTIEEEDRLYVHGEASAPEQFVYVLDRADALTHFGACRARFSFCGHVHQPKLYALGGNGKVTDFTPQGATAIPLLVQRRWLAVIGSTGQPRDGDPAASFAMLDTERGELSFHKTGYDIDKAAARIRAAGLPETLALRLQRGR